MAVKKSFTREEVLAVAFGHSLAGSSADEGSTSPGRCLPFGRCRASWASSEGSALSC
jgi:hypothetical protein